MTLKPGTSRVAPGTPQFATNHPTTLCVPQTTYAISKRGHSVEGLTTGRVWSCMALAGVNKKTGVAFLAHFDTALMARGVDILVKDVKKANGGTLNGFVIHDIAGIPLRDTLIALLSGLLILFLTVAYCWWSGGFQSELAKIAIFVALALITFGVFYSSTRLCLSRRLRRLNAFQDQWVKYRRLNILNSRRTAWVHIRPEGDVIEGTGPTVDDKHFKTPKLGWRRIFLIHRAPGSLTPSVGLRRHSIPARPSSDAARKTP